MMPTYEMREKELILKLKRKITEQSLTIIKLESQVEKLQRMLSPRQQRIAQNKIIPIDKHPSRGLVNAIVDYVAKRFGIARHRIEAIGKDHKVSRARQTAWYLMKLHDDDIQLTEMGRFFGRNFSTVKWGLNRVQSILDKHANGVPLSNDDLKQIEIIHSFGSGQ